jgi:hypothetical protein
MGGLWPPFVVGILYRVAQRCRWVDALTAIVSKRIQEIFLPIFVQI